MAHTILISNAYLGGKRVNVLIEGNRFSKIGLPDGFAADETIDARNMAILPPFYNTHTHAAMTILRGYADDLPLMTWLQDYIWPREAELTPADIREGSRQAIREMIKSGTVFFNDMYFEIDQTIDVVREMGIRAAIGVTFMDNHPKAERGKKAGLIREWKNLANGRITLTAAPHAIYTADADCISFAVGLAREKGLMSHIHLGESVQEVEDCIREHGCRPVQYLDRLGVLDEHIVLAHCVHLDDEEMEIVAKRGCIVANCPVSNMKMGNGIFPYAGMIRHGVNFTIATDGASSNNNLDMREEMKVAALLAKCQGDTTCLPAAMAFDAATRKGAEAFGIDAGVIEEGKLADAILVRLDDERFQPLAEDGSNLISHWVYSAQSDLIDTVICDGKVLMKGRELLV